MKKHREEPGRGIGSTNAATPSVPGKRTLVQARQVPGRSGPALGADATHGAAADGVAGTGTDYPHRAIIEGALGVPLSARAHVDGAAQDACADLGAAAYATGDDVAFATASPDLHTATHEAVHTLQQAGGVQLAGGVGATGDPYERQADAVADAVVAGQPAAPHLGDLFGLGGGRAPAVQRKETEASMTAPAGAEHSPAQGPADGRIPEPHAAGAGKASDPRTKAAALARHRHGLQRMRHIIDAGAAQKIDAALGVKSRKNMYKNSCEWIRAGRAQLFVLSPIHDAAARPGIPSGKSGYFDNTKDYTVDGATYPDDVNDLTGIKVDFNEVGGSLSGDGTTLTILDPMYYDQETLVENLIHEVQHDADQYRDRGAVTPPGGATAPAWAYNQYQTEFRAYWLMNPEGSKRDHFPASTEPVVSQLTLTAATAGPDGVFGTADDVSLGTVTTSLTHGRQEAILRHMVEPIRAAGDWFDGTDWTQSYAYVAYYMVTDPQFLAMVNSFDRPVSGNALNSVRIQDLSDAVAASDGAAILRALAHLDMADRVFLRDAAQSKPFWDQCDRDLSFPMSIFTAVIRATVNDGAPPPVAGGGTYTVVRGDNLSVIAARVLGNMSRWREIYALNHAVIGKDPNHIEPGQVLALPLP